MVREELFYLLLLNRTRSTKYSMEINKLRSRPARPYMRNNAVQLVAVYNRPDKVSELSRIIISIMRATRSSEVLSTELRTQALIMTGKRPSIKS